MQQGTENPPRYGTWGCQSIDKKLWAYDVLTARQPGTRFGPVQLPSGSMFKYDAFLEARSALSTAAADFPTSTDQGA